MHKNPITLKKVTEKDVYVLKELSIKTFSNTYASFNSKENMDIYLKEHFSTNQLRNEIKSKNSTFFFGYLKGDLLGYFKININDAQSEKIIKNSLEIERIYVQQEFQGNGIGYYFIKEIIKLAIQLKLSTIWLGVWDKNKKAIRFYEKNNFTLFNKHIFKLGADEQTDFMMKYSF